MTGIDSWSTTPATNATADAGAVNWAELQLPSTVNDTARQMCADIRSAFNDLAWFQYGSGDQGSGNVAVPAVYASATTFTLAGVNVTATFHRNRRVRAVGTSTGTIYGTIVASTFSTNTTVTVFWDSGSLVNETLTISLSQFSVLGNPLPIAKLSLTDIDADYKGMVADWIGTTGFDNVTAWNAIKTFASRLDPEAWAAQGCNIQLGIGLYSFSSKPNPLGVRMSVIGRGMEQSGLVKSYNEATDTNGLLSQDLFVEGAIVRDLGLVNNGTGGTGFSFIQSSSSNGGYWSLENVHIATNTASNWKYCIYVSGLDKPSSPIGVRAITFRNVKCFSADTAMAYFGGVENMSWWGGGFYNTGSASVVKFVADDDTPTTNIQFHPEYLLDLELSSGTAGINGFNMSLPMENYLNSITFTGTGGGGVFSNCVFIVPKILSVIKSGSCTFNNCIILGSVTTKVYLPGLIYIDPDAQNSIVSYSVPNGQTFTLTPLSSHKLLELVLSSGQTALFHGSYTNSTITEISDPDAIFQNSSTPSAGQVGVFKSSSSHVVSVKNNVGSTLTINVVSIGTPIITVTAPA